MMIYYITECPKCKVIQSNFTKDFNKAIMNCRSCRKSVKITHRGNMRVRILKKSYDPNEITQLCLKIKEELKKNVL